MRGNVLFVAIFLIAILVAFVTAYSVRFNLFGGGEGTIQKTSLQSDVYTMGHALDAAKLYMDASLRYSVYQACYDTLAGSLESAELSDEEFYDTMETLTQTYLNRYAESSYAFLTDYRVVLPTSTVTITPGSGSQFTVTTVPGDMMTTNSIVKSGESVTLKASADLAEQSDMPCLPLYSLAREQNPQIKADFESAFSDAQGFIEDLILAGVPSCSDIKSCSGELTKELKEKLTSSLSDSYERGNYLITSELLDASVTVELMEAGEIRSYTTEATQRVTIQEADPTYYPVWDGEEIAFDSMKLVYINTASAGSV